ncbi:MAG: thioredoxin family protein [Mangrovibacterium sp.]|jgi:small redox-active disulfide protein 2
MNIKVLGTGCPKCKALEQAARNAVAEMAVSADIEKVEDIVNIMGYGIMHTPALVIDGKVAVSGRVPSVAEIKEMISKHQ